MKIKLIIWDLDNTLWNGTLELNNIDNELVNYIKYFNKHGVVNTICSNNNYNKTIKVLKELNILDQFIMPNINYSPKGIRIKNLIEKFQLRDINVLFIDDIDNNLNETKYYNKNINILNPNNKDLLFETLNHIKNNNECDNYKRFKRYKILEKKNKEMIKYDDNHQFLIDSNIEINIIDNKEILINLKKN